MVSPDLISMIPYVVTIVALVLFVGKAHTPAANGKIFVKSEIIKCSFQIYSGLHLRLSWVRCRPEKTKSLWGRKEKENYDEYTNCA